MGVLYRPEQTELDESIVFRYMNTALVRATNNIENRYNFDEYDFIYLLLIDKLNTMNKINIINDSNELYFIELVYIGVNVAIKQCAILNTSTSLKSYALHLKARLEEYSGCEHINDILIDYNDKIMFISENMYSDEY